MEAKWGKWVLHFFLSFFEWWRIAEGSVLRGVSECSCWSLKERSLFLWPCCAAFIFNQYFGREQWVAREEILTENIFLCVSESPSLSLMGASVLALCQLLFVALASFFKECCATLTCPGVKPTPPAGEKQALMITGSHGTPSKWPFYELMQFWSPGTFNGLGRTLTMREVCCPCARLKSGHVG